MTAELVAARLDELVRSRVASSPRPLADLDVARALRAIAPAAHEDARWAEAVLASLARIRRAEVDARGAAPAGAAGAADDAARQEAPGLIPAGAPWKRVAERIVPGLALGVRPDDQRAHKRLADKHGWAAAIVGRALGLWREGAPPTAAAVCDALVWTRLDLGGKAKRIPPEIRAHFVALELGVARAAPERLLRQLAAARSGAARADVRALREALARRWLCGEEWGALRVPTDFAAAVRAAATTATDGLFGERKVFIAALWRGLRDRPAFAALSLDEFKAELLTAHRAGLLRLARADLVAAMDPAEVAASETNYLEAQYHFVEREGGS